MTKIKIEGRQVEAGDDWETLSNEEKSARVDRLGKQQMIVSPTAPPAYRSTVLPIQRTADGRIRPDWGLPGTIVRGLYETFKLPGDIAIGDQPVHDPQTGQYDPKFIDRTALATPDFLGAAPGALSGRRSMAPTPTSQQLMDAGSAGFNQARMGQLQYGERDVRGMVGNLEAQHQRQGIVGDLAAGPRGTIANMSPAYGQNVDLDMLLSHRQTLMDTARTAPDAQARMVAAQGVQAIDRLIENPTAQVAGNIPAQEAAEILRQARGNQAAGHRSNTLTGDLDPHVSGLMERAQLQADVSHSGRNYDNVLRQKVKVLLQDRANLAGYDAAERAQLRAVAEGTATENLMRLWGNRLGGGGGLGQYGVGTSAGTMASGAALMSGVEPSVAAGIGLATGGATSYLGSALKAIENLMARRGIENVDEAVRRRSPLYEQRAARQDPAASRIGIGGAELTARDIAALQILMPGLLGGPTQERRRLEEINPPPPPSLPRGFI